MRTDLKICCVVLICTSWMFASKPMLISIDHHFEAGGKVTNSLLTINFR